MNWGQLDRKTNQVNNWSTLYVLDWLSSEPSASGKNWKNYSLWMEKLKQTQYRLLADKISILWFQ